MSRIQVIALAGCAAVAGLAALLHGQGNFGAVRRPGGGLASPSAKASVTIAGKNLSVDYFAPSMRGRKIMGGLVPYGEVWCTGANIATGFTTEADLQIGTLKLSRGTYSIWTLPTEKEWTLIVNKQHGQHHLDYEPERDFGRTKMNIKTLSSPVGVMKIDLVSTGAKTGILGVSWETTEAWIPFTVLQ
jgi:hypothetical protein